MSNPTRSKNLAIYARCCWLVGFPLEGVIIGVRKSGATEAEISEAVSIYVAEDLSLWCCDIIERGAHLDRRATS